MNLETGNRAFVALLAVALGAGLGIVLAACASLGLLIHGAVVGGAGVSFLDTVPALVFLVPVVVGAVAGIWSLRSQIRSTNGLAGRVSGLMSASPNVEQAAERTGLAGRVDVVEAPEPFSFAYGLLRPRVVVSTGLAHSVPQDELEAVLSHERYHVANLDPLKVVAARAVSRALFFFPLLRELHHRYIFGRELAADRRAIQTHGRRPLAAALYRVVAGPAWPELATAAAMGAPELLDARVAQLETGREPEVARVSRGAIVLSVVVAGVLVWASVESMLVMSRVMGAIGSMSMDGMDSPGAMGALNAVWVGLVVLFWSWVGWRVLGWLRSRRSRGLDTTRL